MLKFRPVKLSSDNIHADIKLQILYIVKKGYCRLYM